MLACWALAGAIGQAIATFVVEPAFAAERRGADERSAERFEQMRAYSVTCVWNDGGSITRCDESLNPYRDGGF